MAGFTYPTFLQVAKGLDSVPDPLLPTMQMDELKFLCGPAGHNYAISGPFHEIDAAGRAYDLICPKCGDAKSVTVQASGQLLYNGERDANAAGGN